MGVATLDKELNVSTVTVGKDVRLPDEVIRKLRLRRGAKLDVVVSGQVVVLVPSNRIPRSQRYFWTDEWQEAMREAEADATEGRISGTFTTARAAITALRKHP